MRGGPVYGGYNRGEMLGVPNKYNHRELKGKGVEGFLFQEASHSWVS